MIPYFQQPSLHLFGPVTIHAFGFLVAMAVIVGLKLALMRCESRKQGHSLLPQKDRTMPDAPTLPVWPIRRT